MEDSRLTGGRVKRLAFLVLLIACSVRIAHAEPGADIPALRSYLAAHWQTPEDYVISKFKDHDIVFVGEYHRIRHDPELIQALIPRLYQAGIYNLGFEFGTVEDQAEIDRLVTSPVYDEALARRIMFHSLVSWGYQEYLDVYRAAWTLNHKLPKGAPRFRIVGLMYRPNWPALKDGDTPENRRKVWTKGPGDAFMAQVILDEFVAKNQKALVYCGIHHAFTSFRQPNLGYRDGRVGNIIYDKIGARTMTIFLHAPWPSSLGWNAPEVKPVGGAIDEVMQGFRDTRVGFDVAASPFGKLTATDTIYAEGHPNFTLADLADGYIFQKPLRAYEGVRVDPQFITDENFQEALDYLANPEARRWLTTPEKLRNAMQEDADMNRRFRHLWQQPTKP